jgi:hypothetical protein
MASMPDSNVILTWDVNRTRIFSILTLNPAKGLRRLSAVTVEVIE